MSDDDKGPDLAAGVEESRVPDDAPLAGHVGDSEVLLLRRGGTIHAVGARCPHRGAAMADGLVVGETIRCPWHHASFELATGAARAPSLDPLPCWRVERENGRVRVRERLEPEPVTRADALRTDGSTAAHPDTVVIVGGGAAGEAAAETLRAHGYSGELTLISSDAGPPIDRTVLSKGYLAGETGEDALALRPRGFYETRGIALRTGVRVTAIDRDAHEITLDDGTRLRYGKLLLATGARARRLEVDGADTGVHVLRTLEDARVIVGAAKNARRAVVVGASFIGLEAAAALRARDIEVSVVAPEAIPLAKVMGETLGRFVRDLHESNGVVFRLEREVSAITDEGVRLEDGETLPADLVVAGIGVEPDTALAERAGLDTDDGVLVDARLCTSDPDIYAAGDVARWPDPRGEGKLRIEHWQVAQRQGQCAARNILGANEPFADVPFFWSKHYDANIRYSGHALDWKRIDAEGDVDARDFAAVLVGADGERLAMASVGRDRDNLAFAAALESGSGRE